MSKQKLKHYRWNNLECIKNSIEYDSYKLKMNVLSIAITSYNLQDGVYFEAIVIFEGARENE